MLNAFLWEVCAHTRVCACLRTEEEFHVALYSGKDIFNQWEMLEWAITEGHFHLYKD